MDVLGKSLKAGIWCEDKRRSFKAVTGAFDVAILDRVCVETKIKSMKLSNRGRWKR